MSEIKPKKRYIEISSMTLPERGISCRDADFDEGAIYNEDEVRVDENGIEVSEYTFDPGNITPDYAEYAVSKESELIERINEADDENFGNRLVGAQDAIYEDFDGLGMYHLGFGGLIYTLASIGCVMDDWTADEEPPETFPLINSSITFWAPTEIATLLIAAAEYAEVGIVNGSNGALDVYSDDLRKYNSMAQYLVKNRESDF